MKKYIVGVGLFLLMNSCLNNDFMEVYPKDQQTELTSFRSYENFKTYAWGLYNVFFGYAYKTGQTDEIFKGDYEADNMIKHVSGNESQWAYQKAKVPASSDSWDYEYIRRVNLMLDNIDQSSMNDAEKAHWRSVGYFFRAYKYFKMLSLYGDLPCIIRKTKCSPLFKRSDISYKTKRPPKNNFPKYSRGSKKSTGKFCFSQCFFL